jgi:DNA-binding beta-propeller fold protein YncE
MSLTAVVRSRFAMTMVCLSIGLCLPALSTSRAAIIEVSLQTNDIIYDPSSNRIYATVPSAAGQPRGNSITPIDPSTGLLGTSVFVGSEPGKLARTDNGQYLYFGLDGAAAARRFDIASQTAGLQFALNSNPPLYVEDIEAVPGQPNAVAISRRNQGSSPRHEQVAIYVDGVRLTNMARGANVIEFSDSPTRLFGYTNESSDARFRDMAVDANGVSDTTSAGGLVTGNDIEYADGRIYATSGRVIDPFTSTLLGTFPASGSVIPDPLGNQVYFLSANKISSYDIDTFLFNWDITVPDVSGSASRLIRFGDHGLAFRTSGNEVFLITDPRIGEIPEPATYSLMATALLAGGWGRWRRHRASHG